MKPIIIVRDNNNKIKLNNDFEISYFISMNPKSIQNFKSLYVEDPKREGFWWQTSGHLVAKGSNKIISYSQSES